MGHRRVVRSRRTTREVFFIVSFQFFIFREAFTTETRAALAASYRRQIISRNGSID